MAFAALGATGCQRLWHFLPPTPMMFRKARTDRIAAPL